jgi:hypothetical protein
MRPPVDLLQGVRRPLGPPQPLAVEGAHSTPQLELQRLVLLVLQHRLVGRRQRLERAGLGGQPLQLLTQRTVGDVVLETAQDGGEGQRLLAQRLAHPGYLQQHRAPLLLLRLRGADLEDLAQVPRVVHRAVVRLEDLGRQPPPLLPGEEALQALHRGALSGVLRQDAGVGVHRLAGLAVLLQERRPP